MKPIRLCMAIAASALLAGCLEVDQHPGWVRGEYDGKKDDLQHQRLFRNDKLAWSAAISDRNRLQNEYLRAKP